MPPRSSKSRGVSQFNLTLRWHAACAKVRPSVQVRDGVPQNRQTAQLAPDRRRRNRPRARYTSKPSYLAILTRIGFAGFWFFDNLMLFSRMGLIDKSDKPYVKNAGRFWFLALVFNAIAQFRKINRLNRERRYIQRLISETPQKKVMFKDKLASIKKNKRGALLSLVKTFGDMFVSSSNARIYDVLNPFRMGPTRRLRVHQLAQGLGRIHICVHQLLQPLPLTKFGAVSDL